MSDIRVLMSDVRNLMSNVLSLMSNIRSSNNQTDCDELSSVNNHIVWVNILEYIS